MTDVEFSKVLSELSTTASKLNRSSDSINEIIAQLQDTLRKTNVGIDVWLDDYPLESEAIEEENDDGVYEDWGRTDTELGFAKNSKLGQAAAWILATRDARYRYDHNKQLEFVSAEYVTPLAECSRAIRIEALKHFGHLVVEMQRRAEEAVKAIEDAKKFVK